MRHENNNLTVMIIVFIGIVAAIFFVNRWITQKAKDITTNLPGEYTASMAVETTQETNVGPRHIIIDPMNDPLAPVEPRVDSRAPAPAAPAHETNPQKVYEPMMNSVILVQ